MTLLGLFRSIERIAAAWRGIEVRPETGRDNFSRPVSPAEARLQYGECKVSNYDERLAQLEQRTGEYQAAPLWLGRNYTEPRVNYAVQDLVQPGWTTYDVGANFGGISVTLSRMVGPKGIVCSFEANPTITAKCQRSLISNGATNCQLYQAAIYKESGHDIQLFLSDNAVADSIYRQTDRSISVKTLALDDFARKNRIPPDFVKMDIEGAEYDALVGFEKTIDFYQPMFILEHSPPDNACMEFLFKKGYVAVDLQNYRRVESPADVVEGTLVTDILYAPPHRLVGTPYFGKLNLDTPVELGPDDFNWRDERYFRSRSLDLPAGRYTGTLEFEASGNANTMCGIWPDNEGSPLMRNHASSSGLVGFARNIAFDTSGGSVHVFFMFLDAPDLTLSIKKITLTRVSNFAGSLALYGILTS